MENELQWIYKLYVEVDEQGNIIDSLGGRNAVPTKEYNFFFLDTATVIGADQGAEFTLDVISENIFRLKIEMRSFKPVFVVKDPSDPFIVALPMVAKMPDEKTEATAEETV
jgi:hypothetical protein